MIKDLANGAHAAIGNHRLVKESAHTAQIDKQPIGLDRGDLTFHKLTDFKVGKESCDGRTLLRQHELAGF